ncbi:nicotinate-nucleotide--dimethylbenzimidazole phosphoribosyltransferase [bacterium]|nr:nicotinate-nucleotide--dimethylbenzimidazole phosphoribosyltransferase [bacterium]
MNTADVAALVAGAPSIDAEAKAAVAARASVTLRPVGALARTDEVAAWLAGWQRTSAPGVSNPAIVLAAGDHGVVARGVSAYPQGVTRAMVHAIEAGVATSSVLARHVGAEVVLIDAGVGVPTGDIVTEPALSRADFVARLEQGRAAVAALDCDLLAIGEMGIGNTTSAAAVVAAVVGGDPKEWVGPGTGVQGPALESKRAIVAEAVDRVGDVDPMEALRQLGGGELVVLAGAVIEARLRSIPVVMDGFIATAAVVALEAAAPGALDHCLASHVSAEPGHRHLLDWLGKTPLLSLAMRLGEGSGALMAIPLIRLAAASVIEVATFEEWGLA